MKRYCLFVFTFLCGFLIVLLIEFPYAKVYDKLIQKYANKVNLEITYNIEKATLLSLNLKAVTIKYKKYIINFNVIQTRIKPIKLLFNKKFFFLEVMNNKDKAIITAKKTKSNEWRIDGIIPISFLINFIEPPYQTMIRTLKNKEFSFYAILKKEKDKLNIVKLTTRGAFNIEATGQFTANQIYLSGELNFGKLSQHFRFKRKI